MKFLNVIKEEIKDYFSFTENKPDVIITGNNIYNEIKKSDENISGVEIISVEDFLKSKFNKTKYYFEDELKDISKDKYILWNSDCIKQLKDLNFIKGMNLDLEERIVELKKRLESLKKEHRFWFLTLDMLRMSRYNKDFYVTLKNKGILKVYKNNDFECESLSEGSQIVLDVIEKVNRDKNGDIISIEGITEKTEVAVISFNLDLIDAPKEIENEKHGEND